MLVQPGFAVSVPPTAFPTAAIFVNEMEPKFESGICRQLSALSQADGASAIHSAELRSGVAYGSFVVKVVWRVRFLTWSSIVGPARTFTEVVIVSPAWMISLIVTESAGTSSYQA